MDLYLRKVNQPQARNSYRVILKTDDGEIELGSIGKGYDGWHWGIDTVLPMRDIESGGYGEDRADCMRKFRAAWERFAADEANLSTKLKRR
jgi:hypothetical protein